MTTAAETVKTAFDLFESGSLGEAESACRAVLAREPAHFHMRHLLGVILCRDGRRDEGLRYIRAVIEEDPGHPGPLRSLGTALLESGQPAAAAEALQRSLQIDPQNARAWNNLGLAYRQLGRTDDGGECFRNALALDPDAPDTLNNLAVVYMLGTRSDDAIPFLERAIAIAPDYEDSYSNLASLYEKSNRLEAARPTIETGLAAFPENPLLQLLAAKLERRAGENEAAVARLQALEHNSPPPAVEKGLHFELGKIYDLMGESDTAFAHFQRGNALAVSLWEKNLRENNPFAAELEALTQTLSPAVLSSWRPIDVAAAEQDPIFLIGFFRSGTTLLDTILGGHGQFQVLEERPTVSAVIQELYKTPQGYPEKLSSLTAEDVLRLREVYFAAVDKELKRDPEKLLIDKFPANTASAGVIHRLFPNARFIFALRHPLDVCLSCYMQDFGETDLMVNFADLENTAAIYARVMRLWQAYAAQLPVSYHVLKYEDMVEDLEDEMRKLLAFLDVEWSDAVLSHTEHALKRGRIHTPSYHQVAQPIYQHASYRWQRYEKHLAPIMETLRPAIEYFGYA